MASQVGNAPPHPQLSPPTTAGREPGAHCLWSPPLFSTHRIHSSLFLSCPCNADLFIENVRELADSDVIFLANLDTPEVVFEQLAMIYTIPR